MLQVTEDRCRDSPLPGATSRPTTPRVKGREHLMRLVAEAKFRSRRPGRVAKHGADYLRELLRLLRGAQHFGPTFNLQLALALSATSSTVYTMSSSRPSTRATGSTADCRRTLPLLRPRQLRSRSAARTFRSACDFRPAICRAVGSGCRDAHLAFVSLIVSHYDGLPIVAIWQAFRRRAWRTRPAQAMIAGAPAAAVSVGVVSFGIWQEWLLSGLFIAAAFVVLAARQSAAARGALLPGSE